MFCKNCGKEIGGSSAFCQYCGAKQDIDGKAGAAAKGASGGNRKGMLALMAAVLCVLAVLLIRTVFFGRISVDSGEYITIHTEGWNAIGKASFTFDGERLFDEINAKKKLSEEKQKALSTAIADLNSGFSISAAEGLANGDEITVSSNFASSALKEFGYQIKNTEAVLTVTDLPELAEVDLASYISIDLSGWDSIGQAAIRFDAAGLTNDVIEISGIGEDEVQALSSVVEELSRSFALSETQDLSNGDVITVSGSFSAEDLYEFGAVLLNTKTAYTVEGLPELTEVDLASYISVDLSGWDSIGQASVHFDAPGLRNDVLEISGTGENKIPALAAVVNELSSSFALSETRDLSNGDVIAVTGSFSAEDLHEFGVVLLNTKTDYTVEGLPEIEEVDLAAYLNISVSGFNSVGTASCSFDSYRLYEDLLERAEFSAEAEEEMYAAVRTLADTFSLSAAEGLSNGDVIQISSDFEADLLRNFGCTITNSRTEYTVEDLQELTEVDLAEYLTVTVSGILPNVTVKYEVDYNCPCIYDTSLVDLPRSEQITAQNGDAFTGEITYNAEAFAKAGYQVVNAAYTYAVEGLLTAVISFENIEDENLLRASESFEDKILQNLIDKSYEQSEDGTIIDWKKTTYALDQVKIVNYADEYEAGNIMLFGYRVLAVRRDLNHQLSQEEFYYAVIQEGVQQTESGELIVSEYYDYDTAANADELDGLLDAALEDAGVDQAVSLERIDLAAETQQADPELAQDMNEVSGEALPDTIDIQEYYADSLRGAAEVYEYAGHVYARFDSQKSWAYAKRMCEERGGHLATITSTFEHDVISALLEDAPNEGYWLGGTDEDEEGTWTWITGEDFSSLILQDYWDYGEPNNSDWDYEDGENHLEINKYYGELNDRNQSFLDNGCILELEAPAESIWAAGVSLAEIPVKKQFHADRTVQFYDPYGTMHLQSMYLDGNNQGKLVYQLDGKWAQMRANLTTWTDCGSDALLDIMIWGDGRLLYAKYGYRKTDAAVPFCIDLTGVQEMNIQVSNSAYQWAYSYDSDLSNGRIYLTEAVLLPADCTSDETGEVVQALYDLPVIEAGDYSSSEEYGFAGDNLGKIYRDLYAFDTYGENRTIWLLDEAYTSLSAVVFAEFDRYDLYEEVSAEIILDGETVYTINHLTGLDAEENLEIDLTGRSILEIKTSGDGGVDLYLADTILKKTVSDAAAAADEDIIRKLDLAQSQGGEHIEIGSILSNREEVSGLVMYPSETAWVTYDLAEICTVFTGTVHGNDRSSSEVENSFAVFGDNRLLYQLTDLSEAGEAATFALDVTGVKEITLVASNGGSYENAGICISDIGVAVAQEVTMIANQETVRLSDLLVIDSKESYFETGLYFDKLTKAHNNILAMDASDQGTASFNLDNKYTVFRGAVIPGPNTTFDGSYTVTISADGEIIYELNELTCRDGMQEFELDVTGKKMLQIAVSGEEYQTRDIWIVDELLYAA